jgi:plastocyanin
MRRTATTGLGLAVTMAMAMAMAPVPAMAGGGGCRGVPVTDGHGITVRIKGLCFTPTVLHARVGDSVTWVNDGPEAHTVSGANLSFGNYDVLAPGNQVTYRFTTSGAYPYYCFLHTGMVGTLVIGDGTGPGASTAELAKAPVQPAAPVAPRGAVAVQPNPGGVDPGPLFVLVLAAVAVGGFWVGRRSRSSVGNK